MRLFRKRNVATRRIKEILDANEAGDCFLVCDGLGQKTYKITIEVEKQDEFIDANGDIWVRKTKEEDDS